MTGTEESFRSVPDPDRLLAELRAETPEMPAGFHASWKRAVREEMKRAAAYAIASIIPDNEITQENIIASPLDKRVADTVAKAVAEAWKE
jgi:malate dehydrogenase (oxaloacetate-decarboxylating)